MLSPTTKRIITNLLILGAVGGGGYYFYLHRAELTGDEKGDCVQRLEEVLEACTPSCEGSGRRISAVREQVNFTADKDCLNNCSRDKFGYAVPQCGSRR